MKFSKSLLAAAAVSAALMTGNAAVQAADIPVVTKPYTAPVNAWCYGGINLGYGKGEAPVSFPFSDNSTDPSGWLVGATLGCSRLYDRRFLLGIEGDVALADIDDRSSYPAGGVTATLHNKIDFLATLRARAGIVTGSTLFYVTGGLAVANNEANLSTNLFPGGQTASNTHVGWTIGAGVEHALNHKWSVKLEYLFMDLGSEVYTYGAPLAPQSHTRNLELNVVRAGLNYRF